MRSVGLIVLLLTVLPHRTEALSGPCGHTFETTVRNIVFSHALPGTQFALQQAHDHGHSFQFEFGEARPNIPLQAGTAMQIASLSKILTGLAALDASESGVLPLDTALIDALNIDPSNVGEGIRTLTIAHLLAHRGGLMRMPGPDEMLRPHPRCPGRTAELLAAPVAEKPGHDFVYSNLGYCMIGEALVARNHEPIEQVIERSIIRRIGPSSIVPYDGNQEVTYYPSPDDPEDDPHLYRFNYVAMRTSGGYAANANDLARLLQTAFLGNRRQRLDIAPRNCIRSEGLRQCHGLIFHVADNPEWGGRVLWRDGSLPGVTAIAVMSADGAWSWVLLANQRRHNWMRFNEELLGALNRAVVSLNRCLAEADQTTPGIKR